MYHSASVRNAWTVERRGISVGPIAGGSQHLAHTTCPRSRGDNLLHPLIDNIDLGDLAVGLWLTDKVHELNLDVKVLELKVGA